MENNDPFLAFVEFARHNLTEAPPTASQSHRHHHNGAKIKEDSAGPSWAWMVSRILACCRAYPSGVTSSILLSELFQAWNEREFIEARSKRKVFDMTKLRALSLQRERMYEQFNFSKMATIDSIYEKKFVSLDAVLEVMVVDIQLIPGTRSYLVTLGDAWSSNTIDLYLHRRFYDMLDPEGGILRKGRELRLTGCRLRTALPTGLGQPRLLPTEYLVVLLNEEQDDDALLLGAQFCSDTFSSIELADCLLDSNYCFYARLEKIGEVDVQENNHHSKQQTFVLSDNNGDLLPLVFWDESIILANLFSAGSMIAVESPIVSRDSDRNMQTSGIFLEYGNKTRLYTIPVVHREEQAMDCANTFADRDCTPREFEEGDMVSPDFKGLTFSKDREVL
ncbi:hypothetical protein O6H91_12G025300 [Diphasiastrum complanatum]|uniref:Uncharacterized protein n=1 Tax=Diphasiastrum complanatum TaxID=34168 RepID=A0ACC2BZP3_DIPCM|nr:hypothetical protein O6H91_12G025300 [Diphasiastrum complanatum]